MAYWLDEGWHRWPEIMQANTPAAGLYARCGAYIADCQTDGFVPAAVARMYGTPEWITRLVEVGLWQIEEHGFRDTRYFPLNATKAEIAERRRKDAERQAKRRARESRVTPALRHAGLTTPPIPPPSGGKGLGSRGPRAVPKWCGRCNGETRMHLTEADEYVPCPNCHPNREAS
jgi:hypothetical protein